MRFIKISLGSHLKPLFSMAAAVLNLKLSPIPPQPFDLCSTLSGHAQKNLRKQHRSPWWDRPWSTAAQFGIRTSRRTYSSWKRSNVRPGLWREIPVGLPQCYCNKQTEMANPGKTPERQEASTNVQNRPRLNGSPSKWYPHYIKPTYKAH